MQAMPPKDFQTFRLEPQQKDRHLRLAAKVLDRRPEIVFAYAHGSFLEDMPFRDLDIAVYVEKDFTERRFSYENALSQEIGAELQAPFPVDVRIMNGAPAGFQYHVLRGRLLSDKDPDRRADVTAYVLAKHFDMEPFRRRFIKEAFLASES